MLDWIILIMRGEPMHLMHEALARYGLTKAHRILILFGSANRSRSPKNPWLWTERAHMARAALSDVADRIEIQPLDDYRYNDQKWCQAVQHMANYICYNDDGDAEARVGLLTFIKDSSGYYQKMFPQFETVSASEDLYKMYPSLCGKLNATDVRSSYFSDNYTEWMTRVPAPVAAYMCEWKQTDAYERIKRDHYYCEDYKRKTRTGPYAPFFVCVDAMVVKNGHVLLVRRGESSLGCGNYALPGGHVNENEKIKNAMYRELVEETGLNLTGVQPKASKIFDDPERSCKGRVISHAYLLQLPYEGEMPEVTGSDDADWAGFVPLADIADPNKPYKGNFFDDHEDILDYFKGLV